MFDQIEKIYQSSLKKLTFTNLFVTQLKKRKITSIQIQKKCKVSKKHSKEVIINQSIVKEVSRIENCYRKNEVSFLSNKYKSYYTKSNMLDEDTVNCLIDGYAYFYKYFLKKQKINLSMRCCPICERENTLNLDHVVPKSRYPFYSLIPINLVPICQDCNHYKGSKFDFLTELPFHPLYQNINLNNEIFIELNCSEMKKMLGNGLNIKYNSDRIKSLVKLYNLDNLILARVKDELKTFILEIKNKATNEVLDSQKRYKPENNFGKVGDIKLVTDKFIYNLGKPELEFLKTEPASAYFNIID